MFISQSRRDFLQKIALGAVGVSALRIFEEILLSEYQTSEVYVEGGYFESETIYGETRTRDYQTFLKCAAFRYNIKSKNFETVKCQTPAHSVLKNQGYAHETILISKFSNSISLVDWREKKEKHLLVAEKGEFFGGHGIFLDNACVAVGAFNWKAKQCYLYKISARNLQVQEKINLDFGLGHEMHILGNGNVLFGLYNIFDWQHPGFAVYDIQTNKFTNLPIGFNGEKRLVGHQAQISNELICWSCNRIQGGRTFEPILVFLNRNTLQIKIYAFEEKYSTTGIASITFNKEENLLLLTFPSLEEVVLFDHENLKIKESFKIAKVRGVSYEPLSKSVFTNFSNHIYEIKRTNEERTVSSRISDESSKIFSDHISLFHVLNNNVVPARSRELPDT